MIIYWQAQLAGWSLTRYSLSQTSTCCVLFRLVQFAGLLGPGTPYLKANMKPLNLSLFVATCILAAIAIDYIPQDSVYWAASLLAGALIGILYSLIAE